MEQQLIDYVTNAKNKGVRHTHVHESLLHAGWSEEVVDRAIRDIYKPKHAIAFTEAARWTFMLLSPAYRGLDLVIVQPLLTILVFCKILPKEVRNRYKSGRFPYL